LRDSLLLQSLLALVQFVRGFPFEPPLVHPPDHPPWQPDGKKCAQQQATQDVEEQILMQGDEGAVGLQMPRPTMPDYVLDPEGGLVQRMYGIIAESLRYLQSTALVLGIVDQSLDIPHQATHTEK